MKIVKLVFFSLLVLFLNSCEEEGSSAVLYFEATPSTELSAGRSQSGISRSAATSGIEEIDSYYAGLGDLIDFSGSTTLSPSNFVLSMSTPYIGGFMDNEINEITFNNPWYEMTDLIEIGEQMHVDYVQDYPYELSTDVEQGTYDTVFFFVTSTARELIISQGTVFEDPHVVVSIPGYTDSEWGDVQNSDGTYKRQYLGDNTFRFDLGELLPDTGFLNVEYYMFSSKYTEPDIVIPGVNAPDYINTVDYGTLISGSSGTNIPMLLLPMTNIEVGESTVVNFTINTANIVSVYDNGTPSDKSDDVPVLVNNYWDKFILTQVE